MAWHGIVWPYHGIKINSITIQYYILPQLDDLTT